MAVMTVTWAEHLLRDKLCSKHFSFTGSRLSRVELSQSPLCRLRSGGTEGHSELPQGHGAGKKQSQGSNPDSAREQLCLNTSV